jgi:hypothetical protein
MPTMVRHERKAEMRRAALFMARFRVPNGKNGTPPDWMGVSSWADAYRRLYQKLGGGRSLASFSRSIRKDQTHYVDCIERRNVNRNRIDSDRLPSLEYWLYRERELLWPEFRKWLSK